MKTKRYKTIDKITVDVNKYSYNYQNELTPQLDKLTGDFNQSIINEIVLWKVNRYAKLDDDIFIHLNKIKKTHKKLNEELTKIVLEKLINTKGIKLPIASTLLRFKNPNIYQIIDQRVYRLIYGTDLKTPSPIKAQIELYLNYLIKLKEVCKINNIKFKDADRILYLVDKNINKDFPLNNY